MNNDAFTKTASLILKVKQFCQKLQKYQFMREIGSLSLFVELMSNNGVEARIHI